MAQSPNLPTDMGMVSKVKDLLRLAFFKGNNNDRSNVVKRNAVLSLLLRGVGIMMGFLLMPLSIFFVGKNEYGIWLTISSVVAWLSLVDVGMGHGLRNNLVYAIANRKMKLAKIYVSTTYFILTLIMLLVLVIFFILQPYLDWSKILNISSEMEEATKKVVVIVFCYFCLTFILKIVNSIFFAYQKAAYTAFIDLGIQFFSLISVFILGFLIKGSLLYLCVAMCFLPSIFALIFNVILFKTSYNAIAPSIRYFRFWCVKNLIGLSFKFFIIQMAVVIQYQTANIIIANFFSVGDVTSYNIVFKYFSMLTMIFGLIATPLWSAATDAYHKNDFAWIKRVVNKFMKLMLVFIIGGGIMLLCSGLVYDIWIVRWTENQEIILPFALSFWCFIYSIFTLPGLIFVNILNGVGAVKIQFLLCLITPFLYIFLCFIFIKFLNMGVYSVFIASILSNLNGIIMAPVQYFKIFIQNKRGIWIAS